MKRHPVEVLSLGSGLSFLLFALAYIIGAAVGAPPNGLITLPVLVVALGASGLAALVVSQQRAGADTATDLPG
ncbi:MAG: hypothetical protein QG597_2243 [Actinomycetota bacterium]|nr:hypothetical protein [Actinomycetota bacterium]